MKALLKRIARKLSGIAPAPPKPNPYLQAGTNCILMALQLEVRFDNPELPKRLIIGDNSFVKGSFYLEKETGVIRVGERSFLGGSTFICIDGITIGNDVMISWGCTVIDNNAHSLVWKERQHDVMDWKKGFEEQKIGYYKVWTHVKHAPIVIQDKAWIGFNCIILKGVTIGEGAVVGAGSVVTTDVPPYAVVAGNPAHIIRYTK